jgi:hypothetical protein
MKKSSVKLVVALMACFYLTSLYAEEPEKQVLVKTPEQTALVMIADLEKDIRLTPEQKTELLKHAIVFMEQLHEINAMKISWEEQGKLRQQPADEYAKAWNEILTDEQKKTFAEKQAAREAAVLQEAIERNKSKNK